MTVTTYNCFLKEVGGNTMVAEGGTAFECIGKTKTESEGQPATTPFLKSNSGGQKVTARAKVPTALKEALEGGATVVGAEMHVNAENRATTGNNMTFGSSVTLVGSATPSMTKNVQVWQKAFLNPAGEKKTERIDGRSDRRSAPHGRTPHGQRTRHLRGLPLD